MIRPPPISTLFPYTTLFRSATLQGHKKRPERVAFSPDGKTLASASIVFSEDNNEAEVLLWDVTTGKLRTRLLGHTYSTYALAFSPDGKLLATGGDGRVMLWDLTTGREKVTFK